MSEFIPLSLLGQPGGVAPLDPVTGLVPIEFLPILDPNLIPTFMGGEEIQ